MSSLHKLRKSVLIQRCNHQSNKDNATSKQKYINKMKSGRILTKVNLGNLEIQLEFTKELQPPFAFSPTKLRVQT